MPSPPKNKLSLALLLCLLAPASNRANSAQKEAEVKLVQSAITHEIEKSSFWQAVFFKECEEMYKQAALGKSEAYQKLSLKEQGKLREAELLKSYIRAFKKHLNNMIKKFFHPIVSCFLLACMMSVTTAVLIHEGVKASVMGLSLTITFILFYLCFLMCIIMGPMIMAASKIVNNTDLLKWGKSELEKRFMRSYPYLRKDDRSYIIKKLKDHWKNPVKNEHNLVLVKLLLDTVPCSPKIVEKLYYNEAEIDKEFEDYTDPVKKQLKELAFELVDIYNNPNRRLMIFIHGLHGIGKSRILKKLLKVLNVPAVGNINLERHREDLFGTSQRLSSLTMEIARVRKNGSKTVIAIAEDGDRFLNRDKHQGMTLLLLDGGAKFFLDAHFSVKVALPSVMIFTGNEVIKEAAIEDRFAYILDLKDPLTARGKKKILYKRLAKLIQEQVGTPHAVTSEDFTDEDYKFINKLAQSSNLRASLNNLGLLFDRKARSMY